MKKKRQSDDIMGTYYRHVHVVLTRRLGVALVAAVEDSHESLSWYVRRALAEKMQRDGIMPRSGMKQKVEEES